MRKQELELLLAAGKKETKQSIFKVTPSAEFPKFGDRDYDVEAHIEDFED